MRETWEEHEYIEHENEYENGTNRTWIRTWL